LVGISKSPRAAKNLALYPPPPDKALPADIWQVPVVSKWLLPGSGG
jgi:hypothetical protein